MLRGCRDDVIEDLINQTRAVAIVATNQALISCGSIEWLILEGKHEN